MILSTDTLTNQNISASLLTGSWTATRGTSVFARLFAASLVGAANYTAFGTLQRAGTSYIYRMLPFTTASADTGVQHICLTTIEIPISNTDIFKTYIVGASTDTASANLITEIWEGGLIGASAIAASSIGGSAFDSTVFKVGAIQVGVIGACAIGASNLASGTLSVGKFGASVLAASNIGGGAFDSTIFGTGAIPVGVLGASAISASNIASNTLAVGKFGASVLSASNIATGTLDVGTLGASVLSASNLATGSIRVGIIGASAIGASNIAGSAFDATVFPTTITPTSASGVWSYSSRTLTQTAATVAAVMSGSSITATRGDTLTAVITGLGSIASRTKLWFTVKDSYDAADTAAIVQIEETGGLLYINGAAAITAANGDITVDNAASGNITITLAAAETAKLTLKSRYYDVQMLTATTVQTMTSGVFEVSADVTKATS